MAFLHRTVTGAYSILGWHAQRRLLTTHPELYA